jgi:hypothetical protein
VGLAISRQGTNNAEAYQKGRTELDPASDCYLSNLENVVESIKTDADTSSSGIQSAVRTSQSARETSGKIEAAVAKTAQGGVELSVKVSKGLEEITTKVGKTDELVAEVATASREQSQGITQVNTAVGQMDKVTQSNAASAEQSSSAASELNSQAESMKKAVAELLRLVGGTTRTENQTQPGLDPVVASSPVQDENIKRPAHRSTVLPLPPERPMTLASSRAVSKTEVPAVGEFKDL